MRSIGLAVVLSLALGGVARADGTWSAGLEIGMLASRADGARRDVAGDASFTFRWRRPLSERSALTIGTSLPASPLLVAQVIVGYQRDLGRARSGPLLRASLRPLLGLVDLCGWSGECPQNDAAEPHDRGGWMLGVAAELGIGWSFAITPWKRLDLILSYLGGGFDGRARRAEPALDGYYQGGLLAVELRF